MTEQRDRRGQVMTEDELRGEIGALEEFIRTGEGGFVGQQTRTWLRRLASREVTPPRNMDALEFAWLEGFRAGLHTAVQGVRVEMPRTGGAG